MKKTRFILLFHSFSKKERLGFSNYLHCFHPKMQRANQLYQYFLDNAAHLEAQKLSYEQLTLHAFKEEKFTSKTKKNIQNSLSDLYTWAKDFLLWQKQMASPLKKEIDWLDILHERNMDHEHQLKAVQMLKKMNQYKIQSVWDHLDRFSFYRKVWINHASKEQLSKEQPIKKAREHLEQFYSLISLEHGSEILTRSIQSDSKEYQEQINELEQHVHRLQAYPDDLLNQGVSLQYQLVKEQNSKAFQALKRFYLEKASLLSLNNQIMIYELLINHTALKIRKGDKQYIKETFDIYQAAFNSGLFKTIGYISNRNFQNIQSTGLLLQAYDWVEKFIQDSKPLLEKNNREANICYSLAQLSFAKKDHHAEYFTELQTYKPADLAFNIRVQTLIIRNMYETGTKKSFLLMYCSNFKKFLSRNRKISASNSEALQNFIFFCRKLILGRMTRTSFLKEIKQTPYVALSHWLIEKAENLED